MNIKLIEVKFGTGGGSALAYLYGPERPTMSHRRSYVAVHITFSFHSTPPDSADTYPNLAIQQIDAEMPFLRIGFLLDPPMYAEVAFNWPDLSEIRSELTQAIGRIASETMRLYGPGYSREVYADSVAL